MGKPKNSLDVGDERQVKVRKTAVELQREKEIEELRQILGDYKSRAFIWRVLEQCKVFHSPVSHELETFRELGRGDIGRWLLEEIFTSDKKAFTLMMSEAEDRNSGEGNA